MMIASARSFAVALGLATSLIGCGDDPVVAPPLAQALHGSEGPIVAAKFDDGFAIHGVGSDGILLFAVQPSASPTRPPGVRVALPLVGEIGEVAPPPEGWGVPLTIKLESFAVVGNELRGQFLLLDNRVPPALAGSAASRIYRFSYRYSVARGFRSTLLETHQLPLNTVFPPGSAPPDGLFYAGSLALLPAGRVAVTDNITGGVWVSTDATLDSWMLALIDGTPGPANRFAGGFSGPVSGVGRAPGGGLKTYSLLTPAPPGSPPGLGLYPGAHSITYAALTDEVCFAVTVPGGLYCIARAALVQPGNPTTKPVRVLVAGGPDSIGTYVDGCDADRFHPDSPWVYFQPAVSTAVHGGKNTLYRVHLVSGVTEIVAQSNQLFDWANEISVVPLGGPNSRVTAVLSSVGQEHNNPDVNVLLGGVSSYVAPSPMPITLSRW